MTVAEGSLSTRLPTVREWYGVGARERDWSVALPLGGMECGPFTALGTEVGVQVGYVLSVDDSMGLWLLANSGGGEESVWGEDEDGTWVGAFDVAWMRRDASWNDMAVLLGQRSGAMGPAWFGPLGGAPMLEEIDSQFWSWMAFSCLDQIRFSADGHGLVALRSLSMPPAPGRDLWWLVDGEKEGPLGSPLVVDAILLPSGCASDEIVNAGVRRVEDQR